MMQSVFGDLPFVAIYLDDLLISSKNEVEHLNHLRVVFKRMKENQLFASKSKLRMFQSKVEYLGHILSENGISTDPKKINALKEWPIPTKRKEVQRLLGAFGYYRRFVPNYSEIAKPLTNLTSKDCEFVWTEECENALNKLKKIMCTQPILKVFDPTLPTFLVTDASDFAIGCILEQEHSDGRHPIEYSSQKLNTGQMNYPVHAKELFAIVHGITKWRHYLQGLPLITVETDHNPLKHIKTQPKLSVVQLRWLDTLSEYNLEIVYKPGKDNTLADALSRREDLEVNALTSAFADSIDVDLQ